MPVRRTASISFSVALSAAIATVSCMRASATAEGAPVPGTTVRAAPPTLVVLITVDQLRGDMLDRYRSDMRHGYARLMRGAWFTNAFHDHANTETAPGHASLLSGRFPRSTGIMANSAGVSDRAVALIAGHPNESAASPHRFLGTTLVDWLVARSPGSRALSVSRKDRGAILPVGKSRQDVYWYSANGNFTTSTYYRDTLPAWVRVFNERRIPERYAGARWELSRDPSTYREPDSVPEENDGKTVFPFQLPIDSARVASALMATPMHDSLVALFALEGLQQTNMGRGPHTDVLAVSFSATDAVGHAYGPDSREAHENQIRLDETLGWFLDSLYRLRDSSSVIVALSADHGVQPIPALARRRGEAKDDQGLIVSLRDVAASFRTRMAAAGIDSQTFEYAGELVYFDRRTLGNSRADSLMNAFRAAALRVPGVARVDRVRDVVRADFARDPIARRWAHQVSVESGVDLVITLTRYSNWFSGYGGATHGSPYDQDAHVPIIFYGPGTRPGRYTDFARTVDIAPTLAALLGGVRPLEKIDGVVLTNAIQR
jgi:predicted AlkP superfamily pyrophosphatase or phosphodiesterase